MVGRLARADNTMEPHGKSSYTTVLCTIYHGYHGTFSVFQVFTTVGRDASTGKTMEQRGIIP